MVGRWFISFWDGWPFFRECNPSCHQLEVGVIHHQGPKTFICHHYWEGGTAGVVWVCFKMNHSFRCYCWWFRIPANQLIGRLLRGFIHPRWLFGVASINNMFNRSWLVFQPAWKWAHFQFVQVWPRNPPTPKLTFRSQQRRCKFGSKQMVKIKHLYRALKCLQRCERSWSISRDVLDQFSVTSPQ